MGDVHAVLLAAGSSVRMGEQNKLLLPIDGTPLIRHIANAIIASDVQTCTVVTGFEHHEITKALSPLPLNFVHNPRYADGQKASILCGLEQLPLDASAVMMVLGDQPNLTAQHLRQLRAVACDRLMSSSCHAVVPLVSGQRGNPVVLSAELARTLFSEKLPPRDYIAQNPEKVAFETFDDEAFVFDVDSPEQWFKYLESRR